jgi:MFS family permease
VIYGQFRPGVPEVVILLLFLIGGFGRAVMMTNLNTLGYAEVPRNRLTRATAFGSMAQQLSQSFGVSCGAALLNATLLWRGGENLGPDDFWPAFTILAAAPLLALIHFVRLPRDVGAELSGGPSKKMD